MERTIEKEFFKAFELSGVVSMCFDWMQQKYDLGFYASEEDEKEPIREMPEELRRYYNETLPQRIEELTTAFDDSIINYAESSLMDEIANNIDNLTGKSLEAYIFSLLRPFKEYSDKIHPMAVIKQLNGEVPGICGIKDFERDLKMWEDRPADEPLKDINGKSCGTPKEQADACRRLIQSYKYRIKRTNYVANRYCDLLGRFEDGAAWMQEGTVEHCMSLFFDIIYRFANRLDALLLERGINLLWYQQECGIYLKCHRITTEIEDYIGSRELANKYIREALPRLEEQQKQPQHAETLVAQQPAHFETTMTYQQAQSMLVALQQNGFIDTSTTVDTFYYRMTGKGDPTKDLIKWIKHPQKNKNYISKSSLLDFLYLIGIRYDQRISEIPSIFDIDKISNTTFQRFNEQSGSEYRHILVKIK